MTASNKNPKPAKNPRTLIHKLFKLATHCPLLNSMRNVKPDSCFLDSCYSKVFKKIQFNDQMKFSHKIMLKKMK